ncbi:SDR family NAD(P)-dependent oxidoreductase [Paraburkholderia sediminicola]|uniref:SDR family NAD(P)-dependent oxidoreductase n=1 Tax=Paraburkholderia sediminicola TaxID=458836 RepID=UPI0038B9FC09
MTKDLDGKIVAISGGFGCLGQAVARVLAERGARVALIDRAETPYGGTSVPQQQLDAFALGNVDLGDFEATQRAVDTIAEKFGGLDALLNIAGGFRWETITEGSIHTWDLMYQMNLKTAVNATKASLKYLQQSRDGRIVNVGAGAALKTGVGMGAYAASKAGVARFTEALSEELAGSPVTVNALLPSIIDTPQNRKDMPDADFSRWVKPDGIGKVIRLLLSSDARAITGALIPVTGAVT